VREIKKSAVFLLVIFLVLSYVVGAETVHRVSPGENLYIIAEKYNLTIDDLTQTNKMTNPERIVAGQVIIIPDYERSDIYRVKEGDSLYRIYQKLSIPVSVLKTENGIKNEDQLYTGQPLLIPLRYRYPRLYTVNTGDTLYKIAEKYGISVEEIIVLNKLKEETIIPGQILKIPSLSPPWETKYTRKYPETLFYKGIAGGNKIALTFDDGPDPYYTEQVLDILQEHNIPATFFVVGSQVAKYPEVTKRIVREGHLITSHSWSHANLRNLSSAELDYEIRETGNIIRKYTGENIHFLRPPWGFVSDNLLQTARDMGYKVVNWNVDSEDWNGTAADQILLNVIPNTDKNSILLFHSAGGRNQKLDSTISVLPELIRTLKNNGFTFVTIDELLNAN
jgi:peptidoglycan/xylan/chitin deacetylase (PgdA/CDA1 family)